MNKKLIPIVVQLKQNNNFIATGISQNDAGVVFDIKIMDGLESFDFSGANIVTLKIQKPDDTFTYDSTDSPYVDVVDSTKGRLKVNIPTSCTAQNGMHFCTVGFAYDDTTVFETMSFNYYVGENPNAENEDVIGTNEFPVLTNLIAQISGAVGAEQIRSSNEEDRVDAETQRQTVSATLIALFVEAVGFLEDRITELSSMLTELNEAIARGGSVDISQISVLATKTWVSNTIKNINYGDTTTGKNGKLIVYHGADADIGSLEEGEFAYASDTNRLYIGGTNGKVNINAPCFVASTSEPTDTTRLWIDVSGTVAVIKYYDGSAWVSCNTAVFA